MLGGRLPAIRVTTDENAEDTTGPSSVTVVALATAKNHSSATAEPISAVRRGGTAILLVMGNESTSTQAIIRTKSHSVVAKCVTTTEQIKTSARAPSHRSELGRRRTSKASVSMAKGKARDS